MILLSTAGLPKRGKGERGTRCSEKRRQKGGSRGEGGGREDRRRAEAKEGRQQYKASEPGAEEWSGCLYVNSCIIIPVDYMP